MVESINNALPKGFILRGSAHTYRIERVLGQGSFGITYLATTKVVASGSLGSFETTINVAVKEFFMSEVNGRENSTVTSGSQGGLFDNYKRKFAREADNLSKLSHPHIVRVLELFEANNTFYYSMEYCESGSLDEEIERRGGLPEKDALNYIQQISDALTFMHSRQVLHLDLKPSNIMRRTPQEVILIDFGLSKHYDPNGNPESSTTIGGGTPGYSPIEQANYKSGDKLAVTLDVYALGATLYKMLTGKRPPVATDIFNEGFPREALEQKGVSGATISCIEKAMSSAKRARYQSVEEFVSALPNHVSSDSSSSSAAPSEETNFVPPTSEETDFQPSVSGNSSSQKSKKQFDKKPDYGANFVREATPKVEKSPEHATPNKNVVNLVLGIVGALVITIIIFVCTRPAMVDLWGDMLMKMKCIKPAEQCYLYAANRGCLNSMNELGKMYLRGKDVKINKNEALYWKAKAAEYDDTGKAAHHLGDEYRKGFFDMIIDGTPVTDKYAEVVRWYQLAAEKGGVYAKYELGHLYDTGKNVKQDYAKAIKWYREAADQGFALAQYCLGVMYENGHGVSKDSNEAEMWYRKAAEQGEEKALKALERFEKRKKTTKPSKSEAPQAPQTPNRKPSAPETKPDVPTHKELVSTAVEEEPVEEGPPSAIDLYSRGLYAYRSRIYSDALTYLRPAAEQGHAAAQYYLGIMYEKGLGVAKNESEAIKWYCLSGENGYCEAQFNLGVIYKKRGNLEESAKWYRKAAEQGNESAQFNLALICENLSNYAEAAKWYRLCAERGDLDAQRSLAGVCLQLYRYDEAVKWQTKAAERGDVVSQNNLALMYEEGVGVMQNTAEAVKWYRKAAEQGYKIGQYNLARMYSEGIGVAKNVEEAKNWYRKAAAQGHSASQRELDKLISNN